MLNQLLHQHVKSIFCTVRAAPSPAQNDPKPQSSCPNAPGIDGLGDLPSTTSKSRGLGRFDAGLGLKSITYLSNCVRGQILYNRRDQASKVRIPWRLRDFYAAWIKLQRTREQANQAPLQIDQLASALGISSQSWIEACRCQLLSRTQTINNEAFEPSNEEEEDSQLLWLKHAMKRLKDADRQLLDNHLVQGRSAKATLRPPATCAIDLIC
mgnify:CR=1 FL=1